MLCSLDVFLHANRRSSFRSRFEITVLLTHSDANYSIGPHQKCYVRNLKRGGGEFWVARILKELLSQLSAIWGSCPHPCCPRGQKRAPPNNLPKGRLLGRAEPKRLRLPSEEEHMQRKSRLRLRALIESVTYLSDWNSSLCLHRSRSR